MREYLPSLSQVPELWLSPFLLTRAETVSFPTHYLLRIRRLKNLKSIHALLLLWVLVYCKFSVISPLPGLQTFKSQGSYTHCDFLGCFECLPVYIHEVVSTHNNHILGSYLFFSFFCVDKDLCK